MDSSAPKNKIPLLLTIDKIKESSKSLHRSYSSLCY